MIRDVSKRNISTDLQYARDEARDRRERVKYDRSLLADEDHALLRRVSRATDVTWQQVKDVTARLRAENSRREEEERSWHPTEDSSALQVRRELWPRLVERRRHVVTRGLPEACADLVFYVEDAKETGDWLGFGSQAAYVRQGLDADPDLVDCARAGLQICPPFRRSPKPAPMNGVGIERGPAADTPARELPRKDWPRLVEWRRMAAHQIHRHCQALLFYVEDAKATDDWLEYGNRTAYLRDGLGVKPELVEWARLACGFTGKRWSWKSLEGGA